MKYRYIGKTDTKISEIGFGAWAIGGSKKNSLSYGKTNDRKSLEALNIAYDEGVNFYDTSNIYGLGHSENLIGKAFKNKRSKVVLATKFGMANFQKHIEFSVESISNSLKESLKRLQTDYVDILQIHNIDLNTLKRNPVIFEALEKFKKSGSIRYVGISLVNPSEAFEILKNHDIDVIQLNLNLLDMRAIKNKFLISKEAQNCGIIIRTPLCFGFLANEFQLNHQFSHDDHRSRWSKDQINKWIISAKKMLELIDPKKEQSHRSISALRFCLSAPNVTSVLPGMINRKEVIINIKASQLGKLPENIYNETLKIYDKLNIFSEAEKNDFKHYKQKN